MRCAIRSDCTSRCCSTYFHGNVSPVIRSNASMYLARVFATTSGGNCRRRAVLVPAALRQPVADELLVERRRAAARLVPVGRPESRAVRRQHFVDQNQLVVDQAELELRVGDDDSALERVLGAARVELDAARAKAAWPDRGRPAPHRSSYVMFSSCRPCSAFVAGVKIAPGSWSLSLRPVGKLDAAHRARFLIFLPSRAGQITAHHALDRHDRRLAHQHRPADERLARRRPAANRSRRRRTRSCGSARP